MTPVMASAVPDALRWGPLADLGHHYSWVLERDRERKRKRKRLRQKERKRENLVFTALCKRNVGGGGILNFGSVQRS